MAAITGRLGSGLFTFQNAQTGNANGNALAMDKWATLTIHVTSTAAWDGTLTFEGSADDGTTYASVTGQRSSDLNVATTTTGINLNEIWRFAIVDGLTHFRTRTSSTTAGSCTVKGSAKP